MTKVQHTPGPWKITNSGYDENLIYKIQIGTNLRTVAYAYSKGGDREENQAANAKLISAAPDLLEALEKINSIIYSKGAPLGTKDYFNIRRICCNAIAKAKGE